MKISRPPHNWRVTPAKARDIQQKLAPRVLLGKLSGSCRLVAGLDAAFSPDQHSCIGSVVLWDRREALVVEQHIARAELLFPYIPGLLSFREGPALVRAMRKLKRAPDILICDGQGIAHHRRLGIASHLGLLTGLPSVGCAKSRLLGEYREPGLCRGEKEPLMDKGERVGTVLRTRRNVKPVFISVGHGMTLEEAENLILDNCTGYRLPEPVRLADQLAGRNIKTLNGGKR